MSDWKYPLTNLGHKGNQRRGPLKPTAIVRGADGCVLLAFLGLPYRSNAEAVQMASDFCVTMNAAHIGKPETISGDDAEK